MTLAGASTTRATDWRLWQSWCAATDRDPTLDHDDDTLAVFAARMKAATSTTRRRLRSILVTLAELGTRPLPRPAPAVAGVFHPVDDEHLDVFETLRSVPAADWPGGFTTRRDAFVLTLVGAAGLTRAQALRLRHPDLQHNYLWQVDGQDLPYYARPDGCPGCHVTRWLAAWSAYLDGGTPAARDAIDLDPTGPGDHACRWVDETVTSSWTRAATLIPAIDKRGLADLQGDVGPRTISRIVHTYQPRQQPVPESDSGRAWAPARPPSVKRVDVDPDGVLAGQLDDLEGRLEGILARMRDLDEAIARPLM